MTRIQSTELVGGLLRELQSLGVHLKNPTELVFDGSERRYDETDKPAGNQNIWIKTYLDGQPNANFEHHRLGIKGNWQPQSPSLTSKLERPEYIWQQSQDDPNQHPYVVAKGIRPIGARRNNSAKYGDSLILPIQNKHGAVISLQFIASDGSKRFMKGTHKAAGFIPVGNANPDAVLVCEGYATAVSAYKWAGSDSLAMVGFDKGNLINTAQMACELYPSADLTIIADNDADGGGLTKALEAAHATNSKVLMPTLGGYDLNDIEGDGLAISDNVNYHLPSAEAMQDAGASIDPLDDPSMADVTRLLEKAPVKREQILQDMLPRGVVGFLAAAGGTGKSMLTLQLSVSIATGISFLGVPVENRGAVLMVAAEDETDEIHRRLHRLIRHLRESGQFNDAHEIMLEQNLKIISRVGLDNRLTQHDGGTIRDTGMGDRFANYANNFNNLQLVILDPVSRFRGGDENDNEAATRFVESVEQIRSKTDATILLPHHVSKMGSSGDSDQLDMNMLRGASALVDGARWAAAMATMRKDEAAQYDVNKEDAKRYVRLDVVKNSYNAPWDGIWLYRGEGGILEPTTVATKAETRQEQKSATEYQQIGQQIMDVIKGQQRKGNPSTPRGLRDWATQGGRINCGKDKMAAILNRLIDEGHVIKLAAPSGKGHILQVFDDAKEDETLPSGLA